MRRILARLAIVLCGGLQLSSSFVSAQARPSPTGPAGVELTSLDRKADPCVDFYQFACGGWIAANPLPADRRSFGRFAELQERNFQILRRVLESPPPDASADAKKASEFYAACMDEKTIEGRELTPVAGDLTMLDASRNPDDLPVVLAHLHAQGVPAFFRFGAQSDRSEATQQIATVDASGTALPDRDFYIKDDERSRDIRAKYAQHIARIFTLAGEEPAEASAHAKAVLEIEKTLAQATLDRVRRREPSATFHKTALATFQQTMPAFDWR
jgi:putative endopeptidase